MPVILEHNSNAMQSWLDPFTVEWNTHLQSLLKPFDGDLDIYPVRKDVGKVGNDSPDFIVPLDSAENKNNIANFFTTPKKGKLNTEKVNMGLADNDIEKKCTTANMPSDPRETISVHSSEHNAPIPVSHQKSTSSHKLKVGTKRELESEDEEKKIVKSPRKANNLKTNLRNDGGVNKLLANSTVQKARSPRKSINTKNISDKNMKNERITSFFNTA